MWGMKATTLQVVIGALIVIKKGMDKYIQKNKWGCNQVEIKWSSVTSVQTHRTPGKTAENCNCPMSLHPKDK